MSFVDPDRGEKSHHAVAGVKQPQSMISHSISRDQNLKQKFHHSISSHPKKHNFRYLCGSCHVVNVTKLFLIFYIGLTIFSSFYTTISAFVWTLLPIIVIPLTLYAFYKNEPKYLYPFLITTIINLIVCLMMALIVAIFAFFNYEVLLSVFFAQSSYKNLSFATIIAITRIISLVFGCLILALIFVWQILVISSCIQYYEYRARRAHAVSKRAAMGIRSQPQPSTSQSFGALDQRACIQININSEAVKLSTLNCTYNLAENFDGITPLPLSSLPNEINCLGTKVSLSDL